MNTYIKLLLYTILLGILFGFISALLFVPFVLSNSGDSNIFSLIISITFLILFLIFPLFAAYYTGAFIKKPSLSLIYSIFKILGHYFSVLFFSKFPIKGDIGWGFLLFGFSPFLFLPFDFMLFILSASVGKKWEARKNS